MWINTAEYSRDAQFFKRNGYFCAAPKGTRDYKDYWDEQTRRCIEGYSVGGEHITGDHYGYLNFALIKLIDDENGKTISKEIGGRSGKKVLSFPSFWDGDALYFRKLKEAQSKGLHLCIAKARRKGFSYKNGWVAANTYNTVKNSMVILGAFEKKFLFGGAGITKMAKDYLEFLNEHTAWTKRREVSNKIDELRASYIKYIDGVPVESGYKSTILSLSFKDNPDVGRGKDAQLIFLDEAGKFPNLLPAVKATLETLNDGVYTTGIMVVFGTGGSDNEDWADFNELFYNPEPYGFMALENEWDLDRIGTKSGFFFPSYLNKTGFIDADGNSLIEEAKEWETKKRDHIALTAKSRSALDSYITENPWCPKEAFQITKGRRFPVAELDRHLSYLQTTASANELGVRGYMFYDEAGKVQFKVDESRRAADYPTKRGEEEGCITIWEQPPMGDIPYGLYIAGQDPYDHDRSETGSLGSMFIFKQINHLGETYDWPVAEYTGRPDRAQDFYENCIKLLKYYNAICLYENQVKGMHQYCQLKNCDYLLKDQPIILKDIVKNSTVQREKGVHMNVIIKDYCERITCDWLLEEYAPGKLNLHKIYSAPLLKELIAYDDEGNFDRVIAFMLCILHRYENHKIKVAKREEASYIDDFFTRKLFDR